MKTTYLVYKQVNGIRQLVTATPEEWDTILKGNRGLPAEQRRYFIKDCFADGDELDCMYIEMTAVEYREWNSKNTVTAETQSWFALLIFIFGRRCAGNRT